MVKILRAYFPLAHWIRVCAILSLGLALFSLGLRNPALELARAAHPGDPGKIAYSESKDNSCVGSSFLGHWLINPDGTGKEAQTIHGWEPVWSPDGSKIAFIGTNGLLYVANSDGSNSRSLNTVGSRPSWSPDGRKLAFSRNVADPYDASDVFVIDLESGSETRLTHDAQAGDVYISNGEPSWHPDPGVQRIAYGRFVQLHINQTRQVGIWTMREDGSDADPLVVIESTYSEPGMGFRRQDWSPGGDQLVTRVRLWDETGNPTYRIGSVSWPQGEVTLLTPPHGQYEDDYLPVWSPDGSKIAFMSARGSPNTLHLWVMDADGDHMQQVPNSGQSCYNYGGLGWQVLPEQPPLVVNSTDDDSDVDPGDLECDTGQDLPDGDPECTLQAAIEESNARASKDTITFNIPGSGVPLIEAPDGFEVTAPVVIDATTQPGGSKVEVTGGVSYGGNCGSAIDPPKYGFTLLAGHSTLRGLVIHGYCDWAIRLKGDQNVIEGNYIGTDAAGLQALGNGGRPSPEPGGGWDGGGILIESSGNLIGGWERIDCDHACNLISGNDLALAHTGDWANQPTGVKIVSLAAHSNIIYGNYIGTDITGLKMPNGTPHQVHGIKIESSPSNVIGGQGMGMRNLISGNESTGVLIRLGGDYNIVEGNYIGVNESRSGIIAGSEQDGVRITSSKDNQILHNIIASEFVSSGGRDQTGVLIENGTSTGNLIRDNYIGTDEHGLVILEYETGITIQNDAVDNILESNLVAFGKYGMDILSGPNLVKKNLIVKNDEWGVFIGKPTTGAILVENGIYNNKIGISIGGGVHNCEIVSNYIDNSELGIWLEAPDIGEETKGIRISQNSIHDNNPSGVVPPPLSGLGIDLAPAGHNLNDIGDLDWLGPNTLLNFPEPSFAILNASGDLRIGGNYASILGSHLYHLEFFANSACDPTGYGEGESYLGKADVTTGLGGSAVFDITLPKPSVSPIKWITATAIDEGSNTSEFSPCVQAQHGTALSANAGAGSEMIQVDSTQGFLMGDLIRINPGGTNQEDNQVTGFGSLLLATPLQFAHLQGEPVIILSERIYLPVVVK